MKTFGKILLGLIVLLVILNFLLEPIALKYVNKTLNNIEGYRGEVKDLDIALWRGAYRIDSLKLDKLNGDFPEPFFATEAIDISIEWRALFNGAIVGEIIVEKPKLIFAVEPDGEEVQAGEENDWVQTVKDLVPLQINRFEIIDGNIRYKDYSPDPNVDVGLTNFNVLATNLGNVVDEGELLPSHVAVSSNTSGNGKLNAQMDINVLKEIPDFDFSMEIDKMELTYLKDFTDAYANFTFKEGNLYVSSEVAMKDGKYDGYVKPLINNVSVVDLDDSTTTFWRKAWEVVVGGVIEVFENQKKDQFATKVPFSGNIKDTDVAIWTTLGNIIRNAFIESFNKNIDSTVNLKSVNDAEEDEGFFKTIFNGDKKNEDQAKEKGKEEKK
ncbi:protein of unknown function (DUF748) [Owenweeksia hongkongensis DSM 17368]|uniref:DUF748 domain-containing protein n=1 Tax=Owenweeksia hongkongensis (strain DSM 17368 / CIP 108786 / JCM 12287 / NRRL B-23963 / UST20020801) TaxID=926562 RepID=G8R3H5_OWEHD|nr:DUF748 domain-containing protein [Owenweeksia hongkongensis]AEV33031.1 protein of unknown function (DUF748) [Owenweeksia hongkongensis DSM 17368]